MTTRSASVSTVSPPLLYPMGPFDLAWRSVVLYFANLRTMLTLGLMFAVPYALLTLIDGPETTDTAGTLQLVWLYLGIIPLQVVATLLASLYLIGLRPSLMQTLRRLRGPVIIQLLGTTILQTVTFLGLGRFLLAGPVVVLEHTSFFGALRRSWRLTRGNWLRVLWHLVIGLVLSFVFFLPLAVAASPLWDDLPFLGSMVLGLAYSMNVSIWTIYLVLLYYDMRVRNEALNVEILRQPG